MLCGRFLYFGELRNVRKKPKYSQRLVELKLAATCKMCFCVIRIK